MTLVRAEDSWAAEYPVYV